MFEFYDVYLIKRELVCCVWSKSYARCAKKLDVITYLANKVAYVRVSNCRGTGEAFDWFLVDVGCRYKTRNDKKVRGTILKHDFTVDHMAAELNYSAPHFSFSRKGFSCVFPYSLSFFLFLSLSLSRMDAVKSDTTLHKRFNT